MTEFDHHGLPDDDDIVTSILDQLGISEHTDEDCRVSGVMYKIAKRESGAEAVIVEGRMVWLFQPDGRVMRAKMSAADRRKLVAGSSTPMATRSG